MSDTLHDDLHKEKFQLERIALFSDAVFAIAITLLIIEIKVPEIHGEHITDKDLFYGLLGILAKFIGFIVSFFVIGLYWLSHHRMFRYITRSSQKLLWNNLLFLLPIVIMPFSTSFLSEFFNGTLRMPLGVYAVNICLAGFFSYRLWRIIGDPKNELSHGLDLPVMKYNRARALIIPFMFLCLFLLSFINTWIPYFILPFTPVVTTFIKRYFIKKYPNIIKSHLV